MRLQNRNKLLEISSFILILIVFIQIITSAIFLYNQNNNLNIMKKANKFSEIISELLHRTQQERGAGAGYLGKNSKEFRNLYLKKIELTNKVINNLLDKSKKCNKISIKEVKYYLNKLKKVRKEVLNNKIDLAKEIEFYSKMNASLLDSMGKMLLISNDAELLRSFSSYKNFEMAKERVGIERAVLSGVFSQNKWNKRLYILYVNLLSEQKILFKLSMELTTKSIRDRFYDMQKSETFKKVAKIEQIAFNKKANFDVNPLNFYNTITTKINMLNKIAISMSKLNNEIINNLQNSLWRQFLYQFVIDILLIIFLFYTLFLFHKEQKALFKKSIKDKLTNLYNREFLLEIFDTLKAKIDRNRTKLALFFLDLDGFKAINDTYGHESGDIVLIEIANRLKNLFRKSDIVVRLGGDEFVILAQDIKYDDIKILANKIIKEITKPITLKNEIKVKVGTSIGISIYPDNADNITDLIKKADEAMYFSKRSGKGIFTIYN